MTKRYYPEHWGTWRPELGKPGYIEYGIIRVVNFTFTTYNEYWEKPVTYWRYLFSYSDSYSYIKQDVIALVHKIHPDAHDFTFDITDNNVKPKYDKDFIMEHGIGAF